VVASGTLGIEDAGEEALAPLIRSSRRPANDVRDGEEAHLALVSNRAQRFPVSNSFLKEKPRRVYPIGVQILLGPSERFEIDECQPKTMALVDPPVRTQLRVRAEVAVTTNHSAQVSGAILVVLDW
jgi:hypothetical protein